MKWMRRFLVLTILGLLVLYPLLAPPAHRIDRAHFDKIHVGMTRHQVEGIFGVPAGGYDWAELENPQLWTYVVLVESLEWAPRAPRFQDLSVNYLAEVPQQLTVNEVIVETPFYKTNHPKTARYTHASWTSRQGSFLVWFDEHGLVTSTTHVGEVKIVPPWQRWWRKYSGK